MRRKGHIRERTPGSFEIRYSWVDLTTGRRRTATATVHGSRKEADKELRRRLIALDEGGQVDPSRITVAQWLTQWLEMLSTEVSPKTHERYGELLRHFAIPAIGHFRVQKLAPVSVQAALAQLAVGGRRDNKKGGLSAQTRHNIHTVLKIAFNRALRLRLLQKNPMEDVEPPKITHKPMLVLSAEQSARLLNAIKHTRTYWPVLIILTTGMRRGEVLALRWRSVDLDHGVIRVVESLEETARGLRFKETKTERGRAIALPAYAVTELRRHKNEQAKTLQALGIQQNDNTLLCPRANPFDKNGKPDRDGGPLSPDSCTHEFARLVRGIDGMPPVSLHNLRHSQASQLLLQGVHPKVVQERLGHSSIAVTMDIYSHLIPTLQDDAAARLDAAFRSALSGVDRR